ncbi:MAG TPA: phosphonopyruvate decarboxylase [Bdellovibrionota bacterium]|nr:phosphonopyruvate decarboxylase [Bdellovibrionota bacterium]
MLDVGRFFRDLSESGFSFFTGVPDSLLKDFCAFLGERVPSANHVIAANEGAAVAMAAGYHLATGSLPVVYLQNSGLGNAINPLLTLADPEVYAIPILFLVGWRGEPGLAPRDEPQHAKQGRTMLKTLEAMELEYDIVDAASDCREIFRSAAASMRESGRSRFLVVRKGTFAPYVPTAPASGGKYDLSREDAIRLVLDTLAPEDLVVSATGMISRELYVLREKSGIGHRNDFLSIGSMGHCSQIALGLARELPSRRVYCLDGDGSVIMHMGSLAVAGSEAGANFRHVILNNGAHDSVGGQPTAGFRIDFCAIAKACGYRSSELASTREEAERAARRLAAAPGPSLLELRVKKGAREDLGRPDLSPIESKIVFMKGLRDARE